jgi:hypothetical protein
VDDAMFSEAIDFDEPIERRKWLARLVASAKGHAKKADRSFELTTELIERLYAKQKGRCEVTGLPFTRQRFDEALVKHPFAPSIDRRSSSGGYTKDNVRLVCVAVNFGMGRVRRLLVDRHARRTVPMVDPENTPLRRHRSGAQSELHLPSPPWPIRRAAKPGSRYLSSETSSMRQPLKMLLAAMVTPLT